MHFLARPLLLTLIFFSIQSYASIDQFIDYINRELQKETPNLQQIATNLDAELNQIQFISFHQQSNILLSLENILLNEQLDDDTRTIFEGLETRVLLALEEIEEEEEEEEIEEEEEEIEEIEPSPNCLCNNCKSFTG